MGEWPEWVGGVHEMRTDVEVTGFTTGFPGTLGGPRRQRRRRRWGRGRGEIETSEYGTPQGHRKRLLVRGIPYLEVKVWGNIRSPYREVSLFGGSFSEFSLYVFCKSLFNNCAWDIHAWAKKFTLMPFIPIGHFSFLFC